MTSTYTGSGLELIQTGAQNGTWGATTNTNMSIIDRIVNGVGAITLSGSTYTLQTSDGVLSEGNYGVLVFGGAPASGVTVTVAPNDASHIYLVRNASGQTVTLTQGSGGDVSIANGDTKIVYCDGGGSGAAVYDFSSQLGMSSPSITGGTLSGVTVSSSTLTSATFSNDASFGGALVETVYALSGTTPALDPSNGTIQTWTLSANSTPTDSLSAGESLTLMIDDDAAYTITWPSVTWKTTAGSAPTLNTTGFTAIVLWKVGSTLYGARVGNA